MASLNILCSDLLSFLNEVTKKNQERKTFFCGPSKIFKNISWPINICLKYFMAPAKVLQPPPPTYLMYGPLTQEWFVNKKFLSV